MDNNDLGRVLSAPGSHEPSPAGLGPSGFDPSRGLPEVTPADALAAAAIDQPYTDIIHAFARHRQTSTARLEAEIQRLRKAMQDIASLINMQADCLIGYAEGSGFKEKPIPSVFHFQAQHFRDLAGDLLEDMTSDSD